MKRFLNRSIVATVMTLGLYACGGGGGGSGGEQQVKEPTTPPQAVVNQAPTIEAIPVQSVNENNTITITSIANDADGTVTSYLWEQTSGVDVILSDTNTASVSLTAPEIGEHVTITLKLTVTDNDGTTFTANVNVEIKDIPNQAPTIEAIASEGKRSLVWDNGEEYTLFYGIVGEDHNRFSTIQSITSPYSIDWLDIWFEEYEFHLQDEDGNTVASTTLIDSSFSLPKETYVAGNDMTSSDSSSPDSSLIINDRYLYTVGNFGSNHGDLGKGDFFNVYDLLATDGIENIYNYKDVRSPNRIWHFANYVLVTTPNENSVLFNIENPANPIYVKEIEELNVIGFNNNYLFSLSSEPMHIDVLEVNSGELTVIETINTGVGLPEGETKVLSKDDATWLIIESTNTSIYPITNDIVIGQPLTIESNAYLHSQDISNNYLIFKSYNNTNNVFIVDISDPSSPSLALNTTIQNSVQGGLKSLRISNNTLYAIGEMEIVAFDLSNINELSVIGRQHIKDQDMHIKLMGEKFISLNSYEQEIRLYDLNIKQDRPSVDMTFYKTNYPASRIIEVDNNIAIISNSAGLSSCSGGNGNCYSDNYDTTNSGMNIYSNGLENAPVNIYFEPNNPVTPAIVVNNRLYALDDEKISIFDVTDIQSPILLGSESCCSKNVSSRMNFNSIGNIVLFNYINGLLLFDADEPNQVGALERYHPNSGFNGGGTFGDKLILTERTAVNILDLSSPDNISFSTGAQGYIYGVSSAENGVFVGSQFNPYGNESSDSIIYFFENGVLNERSTLKSGFVFMKTISNEHIVYVTLKGLVVVNVSDPYSPKTVLTSTLPVKKFITAKIIGTTLYMGAIDGVLTIEMPE